VVALSRRLDQRSPVHRLVRPSTPTGATA
jgi:hypothetical protein